MRKGERRRKRLKEGGRRSGEGQKEREVGREEKEGRR